MGTVYQTFKHKYLSCIIYHLMLRHLSHKLLPSTEVSHCAYSADAWYSLWLSDTHSLSELQSIKTVKSFNLLAVMSSINKKLRNGKKKPVFYQLDFCLNNVLKMI